MKFQTTNPATKEVIKEWETMSKEIVMAILKEVSCAQNGWKQESLETKKTMLLKLAQALRDNKEKYAKIMTTEVGKTITDSRTEVEKCAVAAEVYSQNADEWLSEEIVQADGKKHLVTFQPLGVIYLVMPWNYPFWQAFRCAIPTILAGNGCIMKHSSECPESALAIEDAFKQAGFPKHLFRTVIVDHKTSDEIIASDIVRGVSLTGSTGAGKTIAQKAGENLKKVVLELGGSDPFIVLDDADIDKAAKNAVIGRTINVGQSCIAAKRFIVHKDVADAFAQKFASYMDELIMGDPMDEKTHIGPVVNKAAYDSMQAFLSDAKQKGGVILTKKETNDSGYFIRPAIVKASTDMKIVSEEVFGPIAPLLVVDSEAEAIKLANSTEFGLGGSVWTTDLKRGEAVARRIESGTTFVNSITKSDPRMPFGGIKQSGIGRELSHYGLKEFVNIKAINIYEP